MKSSFPHIPGFKRKWLLVCSMALMIVSLLFVARKSHENGRQEQASTAASAQAGGQGDPGKQAAPSDGLPWSTTSQNAGGIAGTGTAAQAGNPAVAPKAIAPVATADAPVAEVEVTAKLNDGGNNTSFVLALDEIALRDATGHTEIQKLDPVATAADYKERVAALSAPRGVFPVLYIAGKERSDATRRLVTSDLRVQLADGGNAMEIARATGLEYKESSAYAPELAVLAATDPLAALDKMNTLRAVNGVAGADVLLAAKFQKRAMPNDPLIGDQWHLKYDGQVGAVAGTDINVEDVWDYAGVGTPIRGTGIRIGVVDDGMETSHQDIAPNADTTNDYDWNGIDNDPSPELGDDHGTACAGNAGAKGNNGIGVSGSAPDAKLVGMRLIADYITDAQIAAAMEYHATTGTPIPILTNSWGPSTLMDGPGSLTIAALKNATTNGRNGLGSLILFAGGNSAESFDNVNYDGYANSIYTIAVGASDSSGNKSSYSEPGACLVVTGPSDGADLGITTTDRTGALGYSDTNYTDDFGGTSSATPTVAGVVALMLQKNPNLGWRDVKEILIRTARKLNPGGAWQTNSAGFSFNHDFGAGLVDAKAAVDMASSWSNLGNMISATSMPAAAANIPDNTPTGVTRTFDLSSTNIRTEHVTVSVNITTEGRGDLDIILTSPSGMSSTLATFHPDDAGSYDNWTFSTVRHWGEDSGGVWSLKVADVSSAGDSGGARLNYATMRVLGTQGPPRNPKPAVIITSPANGELFSPNVDVPVSATATDIASTGGPGTITKVEFFLNGSLDNTITTAPYAYSLTGLANGIYELKAVATDSEGGVGESSVVQFTIANQKPVIAAAAIQPVEAGSMPPVPVTRDAGQAYDVDDLWMDISAFDPEGETITYTYKWEYSSDGRNFITDPTNTGDRLPANASNFAKLWRCTVTPRDAYPQDGLAYTTETVNVLRVPPAMVNPGDPVSYTSGLVLRGLETVVTKQAIINEFSQGSTGQTNGEWIEILVQQTGSLRGWQLLDSADKGVKFRNDPVWDNIPAGTLIVVYNGNNSGGLYTQRDPLLPPDDFNPNDDKVMVVPSKRLLTTDTKYFDEVGTTWLTLGSSGGSIKLRNSLNQMVHTISYGSSFETTPNIGSVPHGSAAFHQTSDEAGASTSEGWRTVTSLVARAVSTAPRISLASRHYEQDFNTTPGTLGTSYPKGWTSWTNVTNNQFEDKVMGIGNSLTTVAGNYNFGGSIGLVGETSKYDPSSLVLAIDNTINMNSLKISYDVLMLRQGSKTSTTLKLQYSLEGANSGFVDVGPAATYTLLQGATIPPTVNPFVEIPLPAAIEGKGPTIFLRWFYQSSGTTGQAPALAIDNVVITAETNPNVLYLEFDPAEVMEDDGPGASTATLNVSTSEPIDRVISLSSSNVSRIQVPPTVTIPANELSVTFPVDAIDNTLSDGDDEITITATDTTPLTIVASAANTIIVRDDEPSLDGVTPGKGNNELNSVLVNALRTGMLNEAAKFRLGEGSDDLPNLTLDDVNGVLSGSIASDVAPGDYLIVIEKFNLYGEVTSQSFYITVSGGYDSWIAGFPGLSDPAFDADPDHDGLPNGVEFALDLNPGIADSAGAVQLVRGAADISLIYTVDTGNTGVDVVPEWSTTLGAGAVWNTSGITVTPLAAVPPDGQQFQATLPIDPLDPDRFLRLRVVRVP